MQNDKAKLKNKKTKNFIPCDPALNLCRDCGKKIAEGTCPKLPSDMVKREKE